MSFSIEFDTKALVSKLEQFASDIQEKALRPAAYAASKVIYAEMKIRAPIGPTGNLHNSIYQYHDVKLSVDGKQIYAIGPNKKKAPHWHLLEYGTSRMAARPFIRPTYDAMIGKAMDAAYKRLHEKVKEIADGRI